MDNFTIIDNSCHNNHSTSGAPGGLFAGANNFIMNNSTMIDYSRRNYFVTGQPGAQVGPIGLVEYANFRGIGL